MRITVAAPEQLSQAFQILRRKQPRLAVARHHRAGARDQVRPHRRDPDAGQRRASARDQHRHDFQVRPERIEPELRQEHRAKGVPESLVEVLHLAALADVRMLVFDADAPVLDGLTLYDDE